jgi:bifunctional DNA-binding transcriptional regulator/antitoxin component of YhaV-PrlF toxin-antitoxin module
MKPKKADIRKVTRGFQITLPTSFRERCGVEIGDFVEVVEIGNVLLVRPVTLDRQEAQAMLNEIFAEADTAKNQNLAVTSDDEAIAIAQAEIKARRKSSTSRKS